MNDTEWLTSLGSLGMRLGLDNMTELLSRLGDPQRRFRSIHVAGTDGKGSTCAMLHSVLNASGIRTGLYTSPHIMRVNERIRILEAISDAELGALSGRVRPAVTEMAAGGRECTFFEVLTAMAFLHFAENGVEYGVIETGLGGRFDATNVLVPRVSVITHIGLEHTSVLGDTLERIAFEKSGIIKEGRPVVTPNPPPVLDVIRRVAKERGSECIYVDAAGISEVEVKGSGTTMSYRGGRYGIGIPGRHQSENAAAAIEALRTLPEWDRIEGNVRKGLEEVRWEGRMERNGPFILDVSHTADGAEGLARDVAGIYGCVTLILGMLDDKDAEGIARNLAPAADRVIVTAPSSDRAAAIGKVRSAAEKYSDDVSEAPDVASAMELALRERKDGGLILVTGSFHMVEDAKRWLGRTYAGY